MKELDMKCLKKLILITVALCLFFTLTACSDENSDGNFGDMNDPEYLMTDFADQLLRDGANTLTGIVEVTGTDGSYSVTIDQKKVVPSEDYDDGYYIADRNITDSYALSNDAVILVQKDGSPSVCAIEDFIRDHSGDSSSLYCVYLMGDTAQLIQPLDPASVTESDD